MKKVSPELLREVDIWRLVTERIATLQDLEVFWSLDDLDRAIAALDVKGAVEKAYTDAAMRKAKQDANAS